MTQNLAGHPHPIDDGMRKKPRLPPSQIRERRTEIRLDDSTYSFEVTVLSDGDEDRSASRVAVRIGAAGPAGERVADGRIEVDVNSAATLATLLSGALRSAVPRRRSDGGPAQRGQPWTGEQDAELERRWLAGDSVADIAAYFQRTPGGIRARLPRVGCDPEQRGEYLPVPPSRRGSPEGGG
jgi:hypothetical protein